MKRHFVSASLVATSMLLASASYALTDAQKTELRQHGTVTVYDNNGKKEGHFEVKFMPGSSNIKSDAKKSWNASLDLLDDFVDGKEFWREKFIGSFNDGVKYMEKGVRQGIFKIPSDFKDTIDENRSASGSFGSTASKIKNWISFGFTAGARMVRTIWGVGAGAVYAVVTPAGHVLYRPVAAATNAVVAGTLWPIVKYTWNGTAWVLVKNNKAPERGDMTVTFVPERVAAGELADVSRIRS